MVFISLMHVSSVPFQQIIRKRESSSINTATVLLFPPSFLALSFENLATGLMLNHRSLFSVYQQVCMFFSVDGSISVDISYLFF